MFNIIVVWIALLFFGTSALANLYTAGKYSNPNTKDKVQKAKEVKNVAITAFLIDVVMIALMLLVP